MQACLLQAPSHANQLVRPSSSRVASRRSRRARAAAAARSTTSCGASRGGSCGVRRPATRSRHRPRPRGLPAAAAAASQSPPSDREEFFGIAAHTMRRILVDHARGRTRLKRGGRETRVSLDDAAIRRCSPISRPKRCSPSTSRSIGSSELDARARRVVEHRVFAGLTLEETAEALGISARSVQRTWTTARAGCARRSAGVDVEPLPAACE